MNALQFDISCPRCGWNLELISQAKGGRAAHRAVLHCRAPRSCGYRWVLKMELFIASLTPQGDAVRCGTPQGFKDHQRNATDPCKECLLAEAQQRADHQSAKRMRDGRKLVAK